MATIAEARDKLAAAGTTQEIRDAVEGLTNAQRNRLAAEIAQAMDRVIGV